jgi:mRNA (guanine-N7-)-methyltransferase
MPAFDPVRDAVLNSPVTPTQPLNSPYGRVDLSSASPASPTLTRRATDLSVLLNADSQQPPFRSPSTSQPPTLAHLLHPNDTVDDRLAHAEPLRRPSIEILQEGSPHMSRTYEPSFSRPTLPPNVPPLSAVPSSQPSTADSAQTLPSPAQSPFMQSISRPPSSVPASPPSISPVQKSQISAPHPPRSTLPYKPTRRITPASSVMIPMSEAERQMYAQLQGTGTQKLSKRKRAPSTEREDVRPIKKHLGDVGVVVAHCEPSRHKLSLMS